MYINVRVTTVEGMLHDVDIQDLEGFIIVYVRMYLGQTALHVAVESHGKYENVDCRDAILVLLQHGLKLMDQVYDLCLALFQRIFGKQ